MARLLFSPLIAVSTLNQANLIRQLCEENEIECEIKNSITVPDTWTDTDAFLWLTLAAPQFLSDAVAPALCSPKPHAAYVTVEGLPTRAMFVSTNIPRLRFVAVSEFVRKCLENAGLSVERVVHHAVDIEQCKNAISLRNTTRRYLSHKYGVDLDEYCVFLFNGRHDPRKNVQGLLQAFKYLEAKGRKDILLFMITDESVKELMNMEGVRGRCFIEASVGSLPYHRVLELMAAADYIVFPSFAEGFGLPLLEGNAVGRPVLHTWMPPLSEFSSQDFNFTWNYLEEVEVKNAAVQTWLFHVYTMDMLAEMMDYAADIYFNHREEYDDYCEKAFEHAHKWDYRRIYPELLRLLGFNVKEEIRHVEKSVKEIEMGG